MHIVSNYTKCVLESMWFFGSSFFSPEPASPHISPSHVNRLIETWGQESCRDEFLHEVSVGVRYKALIMNELSHI